VVVKVVPGQAKDGGYMVSKNIHVTRRELEILALFANGISIEESAKKLDVSPQTVKNHLFNIMKKLLARSRTHTVIRALEMGMIELVPLLDYEAVSGKPESEYMWCLHCERTYKYGEFREVKIKPFVVNHVRYEPTFQMCPYEDCDGDAVLDAWEWDRIRESHPEYPEIPEKGKAYPLY
jgi:DNA-binding CsgD family transcriptional regulator